MVHCIVYFQPRNFPVLEKAIKKVFNEIIVLKTWIPIFQKITACYLAYFTPELFKCEIIINFKHWTLLLLKILLFEIV